MLAARGNEGRRNTLEMFIKRNVAAGYFHISIWKIFWGVQEISRHISGERGESLAEEIFEYFAS